VRISIHGFSDLRPLREFPNKARTDAVKTHATLLCWAARSDGCAFAGLLAKWLDEKLPAYARRTLPVFRKVVKDSLSVNCRIESRTDRRGKSKPRFLKSTEDSGSSS
jgi:hypothetical protein